jgi:hypothetical protein
LAELSSDSSHRAIKILRSCTGGAGNVRIDESLLGGGYEVIQHGAIRGAVRLVKVIMEFGEFVFENPPAGGRFILKVFKGGEKAAAEARKEVLGKDADKLGGE